MEAEAVSSILNQERVSNTSKIPVEHLDYDFIKTCTDLKYLERILRTLRSGREGIYPHLIEFCEKYVAKLDPRSRALRRETPPATAASFSKDEWSQITNELTTWEKEIQLSEGGLRQLQCFSDEENIPPVRGSNCSFSRTVNNGVNKKEVSALPKDYRYWDQFDVEKECAKIDERITKNDSPAVTNHGLSKMKRKINTTAYTEQEKAQLANREKDKGNEAFRAGDYEEAVAYYTRSVSVMPTVAAYNNRAQAEIKLQHYHKALSDCQKVLDMEPANLKALLRRATVNKQLGNLQEASDDITTVLSSEPHNVMAKKLLVEVEKRMEEHTEMKPDKGKKLLIQEVEEEEEEESEVQCDRPKTEGSDGQEGGVGRRSAAPAERGVMGNAQKKPHGRGEGGGPGGSNAEPQHGGRGKGTGNAEKYKAPADRRAPGPDRPREQGLANGHHSSQPVEQKVNLDAPAGALPPPLARLKNEGNHLFKKGQFGDALDKYSQAITGFTEAGLDSPEDLCVLYSNRAACYLKDGNSTDCIEDCTRALELQPFSLKPLLRRAMAYESLERYRKAYVDYKTVLQIDIATQAAHDSVNRITRLLIEQDGPDWRDKLPEIPLVPLSAQQHRREEPPSAEMVQARAERAAQEAARRAEARFTLLKKEGNEFVKKGQYQEAVGKYSECLTLKQDECAIYTNRALCYVKLEQFAEAKQDCDSALGLEPSNKKAFYRRALANKGLRDYLACSSDLQEVLSLDPNVQEAEKELEEVTVLLRESLVAASPGKPRRNVPITEVDGEEEEAQASGRREEECPGSSQNHIEDALSSQPTNAYDFGQALNTARCRGDVAACTKLLCCVAPESLPHYVSTQLDGHTISFIMQVLDEHVLEKDPNLVYQHLSHLHTAERFSVVLMLLDKDERRLMTQLFEHLAAVESEEFSKNDVQNLANKYI